MNENKPATAEGIARKVVEKNEGYSFRDTEWIKERGVYIFSHLEEIAEEYATLKTQQLTNQLHIISTLKKKMVSTFEKSEGMLVKGARKLTGKEIAEEVKHETELGVDLMGMMLNLTIDLVMRDKINQEPTRIEQLTAENERLREVLNEVEDSLYTELDTNEMSLRQEYNQGFNSGINQAIHILKQAGINLTHKED